MRTREEIAKDIKTLDISLYKAIEIEVALDIRGLLKEVLAELEAIRKGQ